MMWNQHKQFIIYIKNGISSPFLLLFGLIIQILVRNAYSIWIVIAFLKRRPYSDYQAILFLSFNCIFDNPLNFVFSFCLHSRILM